MEIPKENVKFSDYLFMGEVLDNAPEEKDFLIQAIEKTKETTITRTRLLYSFPDFEKLNFHEFIDKKKNILVVIRLMNNMLIAAFTE